jgi:hypothetical protein
MLLEYPIYSEEHFYRVKKYLKETYGRTLVPVSFKSYGHWKGSEDQIIFSRAIAKFHHLIIVDAF